MQFDFGKPVEITGVRCDYSNKPYTIKVGDNYEKQIFTSKGNGNFQSLDEKITAQKIQVEWPHTRGSNGIHFEFLGCSGKFLRLICDNWQENIIYSKIFWLIFNFLTFSFNFRIMDMLPMLVNPKNLKILKKQKSF